MNALTVVILAAGKGTRMRSQLPKVMHPVLGVPMIDFPLRAARGLRPARIVVVTGHGADLVGEVAEKAGAKTVFQKEQKGTGHALKVALKAIGGVSGAVLLLNGDMPLITTGSLQRLLRYHRSGKFRLTLGSFVTQNPAGYGRLIRDNLGRVLRIVEQKDASAGDLGIGEVNGGIYVIEGEELGHLNALKPSPASGEYYVTELVERVCSSGGKVGALDLGEGELIGINSRAELAVAAARMRDRIVNAWMERGVTFLDPGSIWLHPDARLGQDVLIYPNVTFEGRCTIGKGCVVYPGTRIRDSRIGAGAVILDGSVIEESEVGPRARIGPMAHLRPGSRVGAGARVGNFVELKKAVLERNVKASHLSYLGDVRVGAGANIGAGTITCNYDGEQKHETVIGSGAFIGSDTQLVAPVRVGRDAYVGAGTTVTEDVPAGALAVSRPPQTTVRGWAAKSRKKRRTPAE